MHGDDVEVAQTRSIANVLVGYSDSYPRGTVDTFEIPQVRFLDKVGIDGSVDHLKVQISWRATWGATGFFLLLRGKSGFGG